MRRIPALALVSISLAVAACSDLVTPPAARQVERVSTADACTVPDLSEMLSLAAAAFGEGSPNYNSVRGKIENMVHQYDNGNLQGVVDKAHDIVDFTLTKNAESPLPGGANAVTAMVNSIYCFAGVNITLSDPANSTLIFPLDDPQVFHASDSTTAISFPGDPVFEPSLVTIIKNDTSELGLLTKLDRYPGFIRITQQNAGGTTLKSAVTVSVCATAPEEVFADLRLGHGFRDSVLVITPAPTDGDPVVAPLSCDTETPALALGARLFRAAAALLSPDPLHAAARTSRGGGISGTVSEFSPFEPVDTQLRAGGGISGTASEFIRAPMAMLLADGAEGATSILGGGSCAVLPQGVPFPGECLPTVTITTRTLGTPLANVPIDWVVATGSAQIAAADGNASAYACGSFVSSLTDLTAASGSSAVCWNATQVGLYGLTARPRFGGDAPEGVTFESEPGADSVTFSLEIKPVLIEIASPNPVTSTAGAQLTPRVRVTMEGGLPVEGALVDWTALANSDATVDPLTTTTDADGYTWTNWTIGAGYNELRAQVRNAPDSVSVTFAATGSSGTVVINSCPVGGSRDPINETSTPYGFWVPGPGNGGVMREVDLYFGASGKANRPSDYRIGLITRRGNGFLSLFPDTTIATVELRGSASENKLATFRLRTPIVGGAGNQSNTSNAVAMQLVVLTNPDGAKVNFNTGPCPLGGKCKVPPGCVATEVDLNSVSDRNPLGTAHRKSVGITIRGN